MKTCTVKAICRCLSRQIATKEWRGVDVMKTSHTRGWCTRQMNTHPNDGVAIDYELKYDEDGHPRLTGRMVRIQGAILKRGIFED